jgi:hypothetical protein
MKDAFDQWWEWANKPFSDMATIPAEIHEPIMALSPEDRHDRAKVNEDSAALQFVWQFKVASVNRDKLIRLIVEAVPW